MDSYKPILMSQVKDIACDMRHDILTMVHNCGKQNGHLGGCMSAVEVLAVLYSLVMNINEIAHTKRDWTERDRFIMSKGHAGIAMYAAMKHVGLVSQEMIDGDIRGENTVLFRHPKQNIEFGIECSVGSLGMGLERYSAVQSTDFSFSRQLSPASQQYPREYAHHDRPPLCVSPVRSWSHIPENAWTAAQHQRQSNASNI